MPALRILGGLSGASLCAVIVSLACTDSVFAQGKLGQIRSQTRGEPPPDSEEAKKKKEEEEKKKKEKAKAQKAEPAPSRPHGSHRHDRHDHDHGSHVHGGFGFFSAPQPDAYVMVPYPDPYYQPGYCPPPGYDGPPAFVPYTRRYEMEYVPRPVDPRLYEQPSQPPPEDVDTPWTLSQVVLAAACWPVTLPLLFADDDWRGKGRFPRHPYADGHYGYLMLDPDLPSPPQAVSFMTEMSYGSDLESLSRFGGRLVLDTVLRLGLDTEVNWWREEGVDEGLWLGDVNFVFRFAESPRLQWRAGIGVNWLADSAGSESGFNFTYGGEIFPLDPLVLTASIDWGKLGNVGLFHGRTTAGVQFSGLELFVGFDYLDIGDTQIRSLLAGLRLWL